MARQESSYLVFPFVADDNEEGAVLGLDAILDEGVDARIDNLLDHCGG